MTDEFKKSIAIVMPARFRDSNPMSHCTVMYLGEIGEVDFTKSQIERVVDRLRSRPAFSRHDHFDVWNRGYSLFGQDKDKFVALMPQDENILDIREHAEHWLGLHGITSPSQFDYRPHVTLGNVEDVVSMYLPNSQRFTLSKPTLWWGNDRPMK